MTCKRPYKRDHGRGEAPTEGSGKIGGGRIPLAVVAARAGTHRHGGRCLLPQSRLVVMGPCVRRTTAFSLALAFAPADHALRHQAFDLSSGISEFAQHL